MFFPSLKLFSHISEIMIIETVAGSERKEFCSNDFHQISERNKPSRRSNQSWLMLPHWSMDSYYSGTLLLCTPIVCSYMILCGLCLSLIIPTQNHCRMKILDRFKLMEFVDKKLSCCKN